MKNKWILIFEIIIIVIIISAIIFLISKNIQKSDDNSYNIQNTTKTSLQEDNSNEENFEKIASNITMTIKEGTLTNEGATVIITDKNEKKYDYGRWFIIEKKQNGNWVKLELLNPQDTVYGIAIERGNEEVVEIDVNWTEQYGKLSPGEYRLVKSFESNGELKYCSTEFTIN